MGLFKNRNVLRFSSTDWKDGFISDKIVGGENVNIEIEDGNHGQQLVVTANKSQARRVLVLTESGFVNSNEYLVLVDASKNHVVVTLPPTFDYFGQLNIVCLDPSNGIEIIPNGSNVVFDLSNASLNAKGDALTLVCERGSPVSEEQEISRTGTWYIVGRYFAHWYA